MSDTPRTDAQEDIASEWYYKMREAGDPPFDSEQFAFSRTLERELTEARRDLETACQSLNDERESLRAALSGATKLTKDLTAHKEALELCEVALKHTEHYQSRASWAYGALAAIAKFKEGYAK